MAELEQAEDVDDEVKEDYEDRARHSPESIPDEIPQEGTVDALEKKVSLFESFPENESDQQIGEPADKD